MYTDEVYIYIALVRSIHQSLRVNKYAAFEIAVQDGVVRFDYIT